MRIALFCATHRGHRFLEELFTLAPDADLVVASFAEERGEPPFLEAIRQTTINHGGNFHEVRRLNHTRADGPWMSPPLDLLFAVSWRYLIPASIFKRATLGAYVFHDSLLPASRGSSPTVWAIANGQDHTGVTLFHMAEEIDSGDIVSQVRVPIGRDETIADVLEHVTQAYLSILRSSLPAILEGTATRIPQDHARATSTRRRTPTDNEIDWAAPSQQIYNLIRAVTAPYPGAATWLGRKRLIVWSAAPIPGFERQYAHRPGQVVEVWPGRGTVIATGEGVLLLREMGTGDGLRRRADEILNRLDQALGPEARGRHS